MGGSRSSQSLPPLPSPRQPPKVPSLALWGTGEESSDDTTPGKHRLPLTPTPSIAAHHVRLRACVCVHKPIFAPKPPSCARPHRMLPTYSGTATVRPFPNAAGETADRMQPAAVHSLLITMSGLARKGFRAPHASSRGGGEVWCSVSHPPEFSSGLVCVSAVCGRPLARRPWTAWLSEWLALASWAGLAHGAGLGLSVGGASLATRARTHARTHAHTHARGPGNLGPGPTIRCPKPRECQIPDQRRRTRTTLVGMRGDGDEDGGWWRRRRCSFFRSGCFA